MEARYNYGTLLSVGGSFSRLDARDKARFVGGNTQQESTTYGVRMPNTPYQFGNADVAVNFRNFLKKGNTLSLNYSILYVHEFSLYWENHGNKKNKQVVPTQFSQDVSVVYSLLNGRYNFSFECKNLADAKLYDNFSLQKAGRGFYGKFRYTFGRN